MAKKPLKTSTCSATFSNAQLQSEFKTIAAMVNIYCKAHHESKDIPCHDCYELLLYAKKRLLNCPFQEHKPTCGKCTVHCYKKDMQSRVKTVMKFAGPKMLFLHPIMALKHLIDGRKSAPNLKKI